MKYTLVGDFLNEESNSTAARRDPFLVYKACYPLWTAPLVAIEEYSCLYVLAENHRCNSESPLRCRYRVQVRIRIIHIHVYVRSNSRASLASVGTERNGTERNGTECNGTERNGTEWSRVKN